MDLDGTPRRGPMPQVAVSRETQRIRWRGITVSCVPQSWQTKPGTQTPTGLFVVGIDDADIGKKLGLKQGSIITSVAGKVVRSISELQQVIDSTPSDKLEVQTVETAAIATAQQ